MEEVRSGHMVGGIRLAKGNKKDLFPECMTEQQVERAVRNAYRDGEVVRPQGADRFFIRGPFKHGGSNGTIEMWYNRKNKTIETAYPKW